MARKWKVFLVQYTKRCTHAGQDINLQPVVALNSGEGVSLGVPDEVAGHDDGLGHAREEGHGREQANSVVGQGELGYLVQVKAQLQMIVVHRYYNGPGVAWVFKIHCCIL